MVTGSQVFFPITNEGIRVQKASSLLSNDPRKSTILQSWNGKEGEPFLPVHSVSVLGRNQPGVVTGACYYLIGCSHAASQISGLQSICSQEHLSGKCRAEREVDPTHSKKARELLEGDGVERYHIVSQVEGLL